MSELERQEFGEVEVSSDVSMETATVMSYVFWCMDMELAV
jgi:hypothetical protein